MTANIPLTDSLSTIYSSDGLARQEARWQALAKAFDARYGQAPNLVARSPGRVNLIGEHIDYMQLPVLPMATEVDVLLAVGWRDGDDRGDDTAGDDTVTAANVDSSYGEESFRSAKEDRALASPPIDRTALNWCNYVKCGFQGAMRALLADDSGLKPRAIQLLCDGSVPKGSGLSSSSALTTAAALAVFAAYGKGTDRPLSKEQLAEVAVEAERGVGVSSGGMDQTASVYSQKGAAILVDFRPRVSAEPVPLPANLQCVVANSLEVSNKHESAGTGYNLRVVECQVGSRLLAQHLGLEPVRTVKEILERMPGKEDDRTKLRELKRRLEEAFAGHLDGYTEAEMIQASGLGAKEFTKDYLTEFPVQAERFHLFLRVRHAVTEALRVYDFVEICRRPSPDPTELGRILLASHESLRTDYDCSTARLNELVRLCLASGGVGARITGAGWGGCIVSLVPGDKTAGYIDRLKREYYAPLIKAGTVRQEDVEQAIVISQPECGASLWQGAHLARR